jgi:hypothetical protein
MKNDLQQFNIILLDEKLEEIEYLNYIDASFFDSAYTIESLTTKFYKGENDVKSGFYVIVETEKGKQLFNGVIDYVKDNDSGIIEISAKNLLSLLENRFIEPKTNIARFTVSDVIGVALKKLIDHCFFDNNSAELNALSVDVINNSKNTYILNASYRYSNLYKVAHALTYNNNIIIKNYIDLTNRKIVFELKDVVDKTLDVIFDNDVASIEFVENSRASYNRIIGLGKGVLENRDVVIIKTNQAFGIKTKTFLYDIREDILLETLQRRTEEKFNELITDYLLKVEYSNNLDSMILGVDFDVGDKITVYEKKRGIRKQDVINKVSYSFTKERINSNLVLELGFYNTLTTIIKKQNQQDAENLE